MADSNCTCPAIPLEITLTQETILRIRRRC